MFKTTWNTLKQTFTQTTHRLERTLNAWVCGREEVVQEVSPRSFMAPDIKIYWKGLWGEHEISNDLLNEWHQQSKQVQIELRSSEWMVRSILLGFLIGIATTYKFVHDWGQQIVETNIIPPVLQAGGLGLTGFTCLCLMGSTLVVSPFILGYAKLLVKFNRMEESDLFQKTYPFNVADECVLLDNFKARADTKDVVWIQRVLLEHPEWQDELQWRAGCQLKSALGYWPLEVIKEWKRELKRKGVTEESLLEQEAQSLEGLVPWDSSTSVSANMGLVKNSCDAQGDSELAKVPQGDQSGQVYGQA